MSTVRKYAGLPDLDPAPDIYETPELTDDTSTLPTSTTFRSDSPASLDSDPLRDDVDGIDRHRINQDEARTQFLPADERQQPSSSRISGKRRVHRSSERRRRIENDDIINGVDVPSGEESESLDRKLARLRRELLEVQNEVQQQNSGVDSKTPNLRTGVGSQVDDLSTLLDAVEDQAFDRDQTAAIRLANKLTTTTSRHDPNINGSATSVEGRNPSASDQNVKENFASLENSSVSMVAVLDARLKSLEDILGMDTLGPESQDSRPTKPLLPALDALDRQFSTLSTSSEVSIDKIKARVRELANEADALVTARTQARKMLEAMHSAPARSRAAMNTDIVKDNDFTEDAEQLARINALYGTLSTIESMAPLLPSVLERLRSLRDLHANAASASQTLTNVEKEQEEMRDELQSWKEGLEKVETAMLESQGSMKDNMEAVDGWVKELEQRMKST